MGGKLWESVIRCEASKTEVYTASSDGYATVYFSTFEMTPH